MVEQDGHQGRRDAADERERPPRTTEDASQVLSPGSGRGGCHLAHARPVHLEETAWYGVLVTARWASLTSSYEKSLERIIVRGDGDANEAPDGHSIIDAALDTWRLWRRSALSHRSRC